MRFWLTFALALLLAGCALPPHDLSVDTIRGLRLERVEVVVSPTAPVNRTSYMADATDCRTRALLKIPRPNQNVIEFLHA